MRLPHLLLVASLLSTPSIVLAEEIGARDAPIVHGEPVTPQEMYGTVAITFSDPDEDAEEVRRNPYPACTGVLIAPTIVLTAAHCLEVCYDRCELPDGGSFDCYRCEEELRPATELRVIAGLREIEDAFRPNQVEVVRVEEHFVPDHYVNSDRWVVEVGECGGWGESGFWCTEPGLSAEVPDIAVLRLATAIQTLAPMRLSSNTDGLQGRDALAAGYGSRTIPESDELLPEDHYRVLLHKASAEIELVTGLEILTTNNEERSGVCYGDSGGPLYANRGGEMEVVGIASRVRLDIAGDACGRGAIYASTAAHADWIYEKAPEAVPFTLQGGGGCSAQSRRPAKPSLWLACLLGLVITARARSSVRGLALGAGVLLVMSGCGSSGDSSFCTDRYDPTGAFCDPEYERVDLETAEAMARADLPEDAFLLAVESSTTGLMDPDGAAGSWLFLYYLPGAAEPPDARLIQTRATSTRTYPTDPQTTESALRCIPSQPVPALDSRRLIHDAIRFLERQGETVRLADGGNLLVTMNHVCAAWSSPPLYYVRYRSQAVIFDDEGRILDIVQLSQ